MPANRRHDGSKIGQILSQPFFVGEAFTGRPGRYMKLEDTV